VHLSRLADEIVLWCSAQFGFARLTDAFSTGSSMMPQKRNPDAAELVRAKTGRVIGALIALLTVIKALPLAYSKDMQEDKEQLFDALPALSLSLAAVTGLVLDMTPNLEAMRAAAGSGYSTATDLADWLVREAGVPFREAHHATGRLVSEASRRGVTLEELPLDTMQAVHPKITKGVYGVLSVDASVKSRASLGGTAPKKVTRAARLWRKRLGAEKPRENRSA
jgi:argininosuccinate lyase